MFPVIYPYIRISFCSIGQFLVTWSARKHYNTKRTFSSDVLNSDGISRNFWISRPVYRVYGYHSYEFLRVVSLFTTASTKRERKSRNGTHKPLSDYLKFASFSLESHKGKQYFFFFFNNISKSFSFIQFGRNKDRNKKKEKENYEQKFKKNMNLYASLVWMFKWNVRPFKTFKKRIKEGRK